MDSQKYVVMLLLSVIFMIGCTLPEEKYTGPVEKITFGVEKSIFSSVVWVAENKGYFEEQGLDINIKEFDSGRNAFKTMLSEGNIDMATVAQTPVVIHSFERNDYAIIAGMVTSDGDTKLLARKDKGISRPTDLKGKKVGTVKGSTGHFFLDLFLTEKGMKSSDVEIVDFKATDLVPAIKNGTVDAISVWEPHISDAQKVLGEKALLLETGVIFREDFYFVVNTNFIENHPGALQRFLKAIDKATVFMKQNKEESIRIVSQRIQSDRETVRTGWDIYTFEVFLDQAILLSLEDRAKWAIKNNLTDAVEVPNYLDYIYPDILEAVKPGAVTIIR